MADLVCLIPGKTRDCTLAQNIMFKYKLVGFGFYEAMPNELSLLLTTPAIILEVQVGVSYTATAYWIKVFCINENDFDHLKFY